MPRELGKNRRQLEMDQGGYISDGDGGGGGGMTPYAPAPVEGTPPAPTGLTLVTGLTIADRSASAYISLTVDAPQSTAPTGYTVQWAADSAFTVDVGGFDFPPASLGVRPGTTILGLKPGRTYYVQVLAKYGGTLSSWSSTASTTTPQDTTPPSQPSAVSATFNTAGDFVLTGTAPSEENAGYVQAIIKDSAAGTTYATLSVAVRPGQPFTIVWPASENVRIAGGDPTITAAVRAQSYAGFFSGSTNYSATKAAPTLSASVDFSGPDAVFTLTTSADVSRIGFTADTGVTAREIGRVARYVYTLDANRLDHSGTPDPVLSYSFTAYDALGQASTAATGTATNTAPSAPSAVALVQLFSGFRADVTATEPADFLAYRYRIIQTSPSATDVTVDDRSNSLFRGVSTAATFQVGVKIVDVFGQSSGETLSSTLAVDAFTAAYLRENINYSDSNGTAGASLKVAMTDDNRASGGISYASNAGWVRSISADWQLYYRIKTIIVSMTPTSGTTNWYVRLSKDGTNWSYFSGTVGATGSTGQNTTLSSVADATTAQSNAVSSATLGNSTNNRVDLPTIVEARYVELWLRNTAASTRVDEFFPRRLTQTEDMEAETVRAINIAAGAVTVDKLTIPGTASLDASLRLIAFRVPVSLDVGSGIYQGSGSFTSPTTGLKLFNSGGVGKLAGYNAGTEQAAFDTDGKIKAGAGNVILDAAGMRLISNAPGNTGAVTWYPSAASSSIVGYVASADGGGGFRALTVGSVGDASLPSASTKLIAQSSGGQQATLTLSSDGSTRSALFDSLTPVTVANGLNVGSATGAASGSIKASGSASIDGSATIAGGINVGTATGAGTGQLFTSGRVRINGATDVTSIGMLVRGFGTTGSTASLRCESSTGLGRFTIYDNGDGEVAANFSVGNSLSIANELRIAGGTGFYGATPVAKPTVSGSRGGNAALASLLTALASTGLITNSTTA